jgi:hypothetical protein
MGAYKTKQENVISQEALNQVIQEEEEQERQIKEEILKGASSISSPERQAEPEEPSPGVTQEVPEL